MIFRIFALSILVSLAACSKPTELVVVGEESGNLAALRDSGVLDKFEAETGTKVELVGLSFEELQENVNLDFELGSGRFDIVLNYNFALAPYVEADWIVPLDELKSLSPGGWEDIQASLFRNHWLEVGHYSSSGSPEAVALPFAANTMLLAYNKSLFDDPKFQTSFKEQFDRTFSPPATWAEFRDIAQFFSRQDGLKGVALQGASDGWLYYEFVNYLFGLGGAVYDKTYGWETASPDALRLTSEASVDAAAFFLNLKPYNAGDFFSVGANEQVELLARGRATMGIVWSDYAQQIVSAARRSGYEIAFSPIPGEKSMLAGGSAFVNDDSQDPEVAAKFIKYLLKPEVQRKLIKLGYQSPLEAAYQTDAEDLPAYATAVEASLERGIYMNEAGPDAGVISTAITDAIQIAWREFDPAEDSARSVAEKAMADAQETTIDRLEKLRR